MCGFGFYIMYTCIGTYCSYFRAFLYRIISVVMFLLLSEPFFFLLNCGAEHLSFASWNFLATKVMVSHAVMMESAKRSGTPLLLTGCRWIEGLVRMQPMTNETQRWLSCLLSLTLRTWIWMWIWIWNIDNWSRESGSLCHRC